jgi:hypothetical protein
LPKVISSHCARRFLRILYHVRIPVRTLELAPPLAWGRRFPALITANYYITLRFCGAAGVGAGVPPPPPETNGWG